MINILNYLLDLKLTTNTQEEKKASENYENGRRHGHEEGIKEGMNFAIRHSRDLTEDEFDELIKFLKDRNMVLTYCQYQYHNGLAVRVNVTKDKRPYRKERITGITFLTEG